MISQKRKVFDLGYAIGYNTFMVEQDMLSVVNYIDEGGTREQLEKEWPPEGVEDEYLTALFDYVFDG